VDINADACASDLLLIFDLRSWFWPPLSTTAAEQSNLLLVLASDVVVAAIIMPKFPLIARACRSRLPTSGCCEAITAGRNRRIAFPPSFVDGPVSLSAWLTTGPYRWPRLRAQVSLQLIELRSHSPSAPRSAGGIDFSLGVLRARLCIVRATIDVFRDGTNSSGRDVGLARDEAIAKASPSRSCDLKRTGRAVESGAHQSGTGGLAHYYDQRGRRSRAPL